MLNKIIFAIDNNTNTHAVAKFMRHVDTKRALGELQGGLVHCIGYWEGILEPSYMMDERDYRKFVEPMGFTDGQVCIMHVPGDTRQPCTLEYQDGSTETLHPMHEVSKDVAKFLNAWTYVQDTGKYFTTQ